MITEGTDDEVIQGGWILLTETIFYDIKLHDTYFIWGGKFVLEVL